MKTIYIVQTHYKYEDDFVRGFEHLKDAEKYYKRCKDRGEKVGMKELAFINGDAIEAMVPGYTFETTE